MKTTRFESGFYRCVVGDVTYEIEKGVASNGYGLKGTFPTWDLFVILNNGQREWVNDFFSLREAKDHAQAAAPEYVGM